MEVMWDEFAGLLKESRAKLELTAVYPKERIPWRQPKLLDDNIATGVVEALLVVDQYEELEFFIPNPATPRFDLDVSIGNQIYELTIVQDHVRLGLTWYYNKDGELSRLLSNV